MNNKKFKNVGSRKIHDYKRTIEEFIIDISIILKHLKIINVYTNTDSKN